MAFSLDMAVMGSVSKNKNNEPINERAGKLEGRTVTEAHKDSALEMILRVFVRVLQFAASAFGIPSGGVGLSHIPVADRVDQNNDSVARKDYNLPDGIELIGEIGCCFERSRKSEHRLLADLIHPEPVEFDVLAFGDRVRNSLNANKSLFIPIAIHDELGGHYLMIYIDQKEEEIRFYDPFGGSEDREIEKLGMTPSEFIKVLNLEGYSTEHVPSISCDRDENVVELFKFIREMVKKSTGLF